MEVSIKDYEAYLFDHYKEHGIDSSLFMKLVEDGKMLEYMEPFGADNPKPLFSISNAVVKRIDTIGADNSHLRLTIEKNDVVLNAIGFRMSEYKNLKKPGDTISIAFSLELNTYKGKETVQLILKDIK